MDIKFENGSEIHTIHDNDSIRSKKSRFSIDGGLLLTEMSELHKKLQQEINESMGIPAEYFEKRKEDNSMTVTEEDVKELKLPNTHCDWYGRPFEVGQSYKTFSLIGDDIKIVHTDCIDKFNALGHQNIFFHGERNLP